MRVQYSSLLKKLKDNGCYVDEENEEASEEKPVKAVTKKRKGDDESDSVAPKSKKPHTKKTAVETENGVKVEWESYE